MSDICSQFPPFGDPWPSCLFPLSSIGLIRLHGILWWSSGQDSLLSVLRAWVGSLVRKLRSYKLLLLLLSLFSHVQLCHPIDGSPPGSPVPGILQARTLEWVAISFSNAWKGKVKVKSFSRVRLLATPWTAAYQAPPSMGFSRQEYWVGCHCLLRRSYKLHGQKKKKKTAYFWHYLYITVSIVRGRKDI